MADDYAEHLRQHDEILRSLTAMLTSQHSINERMATSIEELKAINAGVQTTLAPLHARPATPRTRYSGSQAARLVGWFGYPTAYLRSWRKTWDSARPAYSNFSSGSGRNKHNCIYPYLNKRNTPMHNSVLRLCPTLLLVGTLSASILGCPAPATVPLASAALDQRAKDFTPPLGQALIYVVRQPGTAILGGFVVFPVAIDGMALGAVAPGTYLILPVAPGLHQVTSLTTENQAAQTIRVDAGQVAFVGLVSRVGWLGPQVALRILDEAAGREAVQAAAMGQTSP